MPEDEGPELARRPEGTGPAGERFKLGGRVDCSDGECGTLTRVVIEPAAQKLTHLVVAPRHHKSLGRLVPVELVERDEGDRVLLSCPRAHFETLDDAEEVDFLPADTDALGYGPGAAVYPTGIGMPLSGHGHRQPIYTDRVPQGEVEVERGDQVHARDGWIGEVDGLVIDPADAHVTHILLKEGHLWGRKQVAIPIQASSRVGGEVRVDLTRQQIEELPPAEIGSRS